MSVPTTRNGCATHDDSGRPCVLVVDDDADSLRASVRLLELNGFAAQGAKSLNEALELWTSRPCDILVADLILPDGSGLDLMRRLHGSGVRGVSVSGHDDPTNQRASLDAGFAAHLVKPIRFEDLLTAVTKLA
jgi:CheY-like chemotaxis protein